jgi:undecaprenyl-diphosphatase
MLETLKQLDLSVLKFINGNFPFLDQFWLVFTDLHKNRFLLFLVFPALLFFVVYIYRAKIIPLLTALVLAIATSDMLCYRVLKPLVSRPRPLQNSEISQWLRRVGEAHGNGFPSNHSANAFAVAVTLAWFFPRLAKVFYTFAFLVALSRVALGVHYTSDVVGGAILGLSVGFLIRIFLLIRVKWFAPLGQPVSVREKSSP